MALQIQTAIPGPTLHLTGRTDAGGPAEIDVYTGEIVLAHSGGGLQISISDSSLSPKGQLGLYVPEAPAVPSGEEVLAVPELSLAAVSIFSGSAAGSGGVGHPAIDWITGQDGDTSQWPYLRFTLYSTHSAVLRYRVSFVRAVGA